MSQQPSLLSTIAHEFAASRGLRGISFEGKGAFKETFRAITGDGEVVALKVLDPAKCNPSRSEREINALKKCNSPLIGKLYDYGIFSSSQGNDYYYSLEEFLDGGTLSQQITNQNLAPQIVRDYAILLVEALDHLRAIKLVHRDIKPDNIMFRRNSSTPVLVDFGLVRDLSESSLTQTWLPQGPGTPYYAAPEQLNNEKHLIGWRTDQFSLGIVLGICLTGKHPFTEPSMTMPETVASVAQRGFCTNDFSNEVRALKFGCIIKMLASWPIQRYSTPSELIKVLRNEE